MPGKTQRTMGLSRIAKHRKSVQEDLVTALLDDDFSPADMTFGVIQKHNGNGQLTVLIPDKKTGNRMEARAVLRGLLGKCSIKNVFPTGAIVALGIRSFETNSNTLDVMASIERKEAKKLMIAEKIPKWMMNVSDGADESKDGESFVFEEGDEEEEEKVGEAKKQKEREKGKTKRLDVVKEDDDFDIDDI